MTPLILLEKEKKKVFFQGKEQSVYKTENIEKQIAIERFLLRNNRNDSEMKMVLAIKKLIFEHMF